MITVEVPGVGTVEFPDGTSPQIMEQALAQFMSDQQAAAPEQAQFAPNGVPMNAAAQAELVRRAKEGGLRGTPSPEALGREDALRGFVSPGGDSPLATAIGWAAQGATFGASDELSAALESLFGADYNRSLAKYRGALDLGREANPNTALASEIVGAMAVPVPIGKGGIVRGAVNGGLMSGLYGFLSGEGGAASRAQDAMGAAALGAGVGGTVGLLGAGAQKAMDSVAKQRQIRAAARNAPTTDELRALGKAAYDRVDAAGVQVAPSEFRKAASGIIGDMHAQGLDATGGALSLTPKSARVAQLLDEASQSNAGIPFREIDQLRRKAAIPAGSIDNRTEAALGASAIKGLDDFINNLGPSQVVAGNASTLADDIATARSTWARMSKSQKIDDAIEAGSGYLSGSGSGIRNRFKSLYTNPKLARGFTEAERKLIAGVANGSIPEKMLQMAGQGVGNVATMAAGYAGGGVPGAIAGAGVAGALRSASDAITRRKAEMVRAIIANGGLQAFQKAPSGARRLIETRAIQGLAPSLQPLSGPLLQRK